MSFILLLRQSWAFCSSYLTVVSISSIWVSISSISKSMVSISVSSIKKSGIGISLPLHKRVGDKGAGSDSEGSSIGVLLHVESRGRDKSGNFMDSSHELTIVSSLSLVSSNSNRDWEVGGSDFSLELKGLDSIGERKMGSIGVSYDTSIWETTVHKSRVSLSGSLANVGNNWGVDKSTSSSAKAHISARLLLLNSKGRDESGNLMDGSSKVSVGSSNSFVSSNSNWDRVTSYHRSSRDNSGGSIWVSIDTSIAMEASIASIEEGGVSLRGSMGSNCQQYTGKYLHCSSVA